MTENGLGPELGKILIGLGLFIFLLGVLILFKDKIPGLSQLGQLPGDLSVKKENFQFHFPLASSILLSVVLTLLLWLIGKFRG